MGNNLWLDDHRDSYANYPPAGLSDHSHVIVSWGNPVRRKKMFNYCNFGESVEGYEDKRMKTNLLKERDANTKFFHSMLKASSTKNKIQYVLTSDGILSSEDDVIKSEFSNYFRGILSIASSSGLVNQQIIQEGPVLDDSYCKSLVKEASNREIWQALSKIGNDKALGPDGFSAGFFYKKNWSLIGRELCHSIRHCCKFNELPKGVNSASIALIPKTHQSTKPEDFCLISCCTVVYKIVASIFSERLKEVLPGLIDMAQGAFIKDRSIVGNICLAQQVLSCYGRKNISERLAWKIDLRKAYDTLN
ncbi:hypothetical protein QQ045_014445 [Rhodiola kirilowii]